MNRTQEFEVKVDRLRQLMDREKVSGILLRGRDNFAWLSAGGLSYISKASEGGVGALLVTAEKTCLVADNIEHARFLEEELVGLPLASIEYPWHDPAAQMNAVREAVGGGKFAADLGEADVDLAEAIKAARTPLIEPEIKRYFAHGQTTTRITEAACRQIKPGMTENDVAAMVIDQFERIDARVPVCLIASDERIDKRRHPRPTPKRIDQRVMVVVCAEKGGLWTNLTRFVNFVPVSDELKIKHRAVCQVDATANAATQPGRTLGMVFADIVAEYDRQGFGEQWQLHHQGGTTGYNGRDHFANPAAAQVVHENQAFAWNPSITGTKSEDTMLLTPQGIQWITEPGDEWPVVEIERDGVVMRRAGILIRSGGRRVMSEK